MYACEVNLRCEHIAKGEETKRKIIFSHLAVDRRYTTRDGTLQSAAVSPSLQILPTQFIIGKMVVAQVFCTFCCVAIFPECHFAHIIIILITSIEARSLDAHPPRQCFDAHPIYDATRFYRLNSYEFHYLFNMGCSVKLVAVFLNSHFSSPDSPSPSSGWAKSECNRKLDRTWTT